jgi:hypothetical protein
MLHVGSVPKEDFLDSTSLIYDMMAWDNREKNRNVVNNDSLFVNEKFWARIKTWLKLRKRIMWTFKWNDRKPLIKLKPRDGIWVSKYISVNWAFYYMVECRSNFFFFLLSPPVESGSGSVQACGSNPLPITVAGDRTVIIPTKFSDDYYWIN